MTLSTQLTELQLFQLHFKFLFHFKDTQIKFSWKAKELSRSETPSVRENWRQGKWNYSYKLCKHDFYVQCGSKWCFQLFQSSQFSHAKCWYILHARTCTEFYIFFSFFIQCIRRKTRRNVRKSYNLCVIKEKVICIRLRRFWRRSQLFRDVENGSDVPKSNTKQ